MKNAIALLVLVMLSLAPTLAQEESESEKTAFQPQPYYGLTFGLGFGNYTNVSINPLFGMHITPKLSAGIRAGYEYIKDNRYNYEVTWNNYGASLFARYRFIPRAYGHIEYAYYNYTQKALGISNTNWVPFLYVGGGYVQPINDRVAFVAEVLFDVLQNDDSPYDDWQPFITIGVQVGF